MAGETTGEGQACRGSNPLRAVQDPPQRRVSDQERGAHSDRHQELSPTRSSRFRHKRGQRQARCHFRLRNEGASTLSSFFRLPGPVFPTK